MREVVEAATELMRSDRFWAMVFAEVEAARIVKLARKILRGLKGVNRLEALAALFSAAEFLIAEGVLATAERTSKPAEEVAREVLAKLRGGFWVKK